MNINIIHRDNNTTLFNYFDLSPEQLSVLPIKDDIILYDNTKYVVKRIFKQYEDVRRMGNRLIEITNIDIIVADDTSGRLW